MFTASAQSLTRSLLLAAAAMVYASSALAAPQALGDEEMRSMNGGAQASPLLAASLGALPGLLNVLATDKLSADKSKLSPAEFAAAIQAAGLSGALQSGYDGQGGSQISLSANSKLNLQGGVAELLSAGAYNSGNSMGSIAISNLDAGGTRLLVWHH